MRNECSSSKFGRYGRLVIIPDKSWLKLTNRFSQVLNILPLYIQSIEISNKRDMLTAKQGGLI